MKLLIVESPAKCKKINSLLGKEYIVLATAGHINTLSGLKSIDIKNGFTPSYTLMKDKYKYLNLLKDKKNNVDEVIIGTDLDREGEAIGFHIANYLNLDLNNTKRIIYNEISKRALTNAINNSETIDINMVKSQQSRQIIDLLVGFHLSPLLWKHIQDKLSAGRCQSPALRLLYDNYIEIKNHNYDKYFKINGLFKHKLYELNGIIEHKFKENNINDILNIIKSNKNNIYISNIEKSEKKINPPYPYITSSIQQDLSNIYNLNSKTSMSILQKLYESGKITYIRTDSYSISKDCSFKLKDYIHNNYGEEYYQFRTFGKSNNSQEAHECIRPVHILTNDLNTDTIDNKVYKLIWKRTIQSQMKPYIYDEYKYTISINNLKYNFISKINQTIFLGFKLLNNDKKEDNLEKINKIKVNDKLEYTFIIAEEHIERSKSSYTEALLIKKLEKLGIGSPSTYANIISSLFTRNYIERKNIIGKEITKIKFTMINDDINKETLDDKLPNEKNKLLITELGVQVIEFLIKNFNDLISYNYTNELENNLDEIANGNKIWNNVIKEIYNSYYPLVIQLNNKEKNNNRRNIGKYNNYDVYAYVSKYGPTIFIDNPDKKYVNLDKKININNIELKDIKHLLELPKNIGEYNSNMIILKKGKYGYYFNHNNKNYSLQYIKNPLDISIDKCIDIIKSQDLPEIGKYKSKDIILKKGKYGYYINYNNKNYSLRNIKNPLDITKEKCIDIINT